MASLGTSLIIRVGTQDVAGARASLACTLGEAMFGDIDSEDISATRCRAFEERLIDRRVRNGVAVATGH